MSLIISGVEHVFIYLWPLYVFFGEMSVKILYSFFLVICFLFLSCRSSLSVLNINSLSVIWFINILFHAISCLFTLLIALFVEIGNLMHCQGSKRVPPLWETVWRFLKELEIKLLYDLAVFLLGVYYRNEIRISNIYLYSQI